MDAMQRIVARERELYLDAPEDLRIQMVSGWLSACLDAAECRHASVCAGDTSGVAYWSQRHADWEGLVRFSYEIEAGQGNEEDQG